MPMDVQTQQTAQQAAVAATGALRMKKISRSMRSFPLLFAVCYGLVIAIVLANGISQVPQPFIVLLCATPLLGYAGWKISVRNLADEVYDCGDALLVKKSGEEDLVPLSQIAGVKFVVHDRHGISGRIVLTLTEPRAMGKEIQFAPPFRMFALQPLKNDIAEHLSFRAAEARAGRTA